MARTNAVCVPRRHDGKFSTSLLDCYIEPACVRKKNQSAARGVPESRFDVSRIREWDSNDAEILEVGPTPTWRGAGGSCRAPEPGWRNVSRSARRSLKIDA